jgi:hypothetical protein
VEVLYSSQSIGTGIPQDDTDYPFTIGSRGALDPVTFPNGLLDDLRLYNRILISGEILDLYQSYASSS